VDYSRLTALLIEAIKSQQVEIEQLKVEILQIKSRGAIERCDQSEVRR
jgi:hypothetical protein